jgi:hypothetical protein
MSKIEQLKELLALLGETENKETKKSNPIAESLIGKRMLVRTYSAGVHIGTITSINPENICEVVLKDALRLWKWEGGGLSLSVVASEGIKGGRLNKTSEVTLTNAIEFIPTTEIAEKSYEKFTE